MTPVTHHPQMNVFNYSTCTECHRYCRNSECSVYRISEVSAVARVSVSAIFPVSTCPILCILPSLTITPLWRVLCRAPSFMIIKYINNLHMAPAQTDLNWPRPPTKMPVLIFSIRTYPSFAILSDLPSHCLSPFWKDL